jgi:Spy/CpxP family protein refolding chaperone
LALAATAALTLACAATAAMAQPGGGMAHGMHGGATIDQLVPGMLEQARASLNLDTSQQTMWDRAAAQSKVAREQGRANRQRAKVAMKAELAKAAPDLAAIVAAADAAEQQNRDLRRDARAPWLALYATFTPEQKAVVRDLLQERIARAESFRERMLEKSRGATRPAG